MRVVSSQQSGKALFFFPPIPMLLSQIEAKVRRKPRPEGSFQNCSLAELPGSRHTVRTVLFGNLLVGIYIYMYIF